MHISYYNFFKCLLYCHYEQGLFHKVKVPTYALKLPYKEPGFFVAVLFIYFLVGFVLKTNSTAKESKDYKNLPLNSWTGFHGQKEQQQAGL